LTTQALTAENTSKFVQAGDVRLHYNEAGTGPPVVFVHGGGPGASGWSNFNTNIGPFSEHFRVLLVDMPGWGESDAVVPNESRFTLNARSFRDMLDALDIEKAHFVGNSFGGGSSAKFAIDYPERIGKLVLMGAAGSGPNLLSPFPMEGIKRLGEVWENPTKESFHEMIKAFVYDSSFVTEQLLEERVNSLLSHPELLEARRKTPPQFNRVVPITQELPDIKAETLVLWGRDDRFEALEKAFIFQGLIPDCDVHVFDKCGHWVQYEQSEKFNRIVIDFLSI
jgi:pimeloyl-ACP methyl ester carboxylesterase